MAIHGAKRSETVASTTVATGSTSIATDRPLRDQRGGGTASREPEIREPASTAVPKADGPV
jgi:hypothetical protein